VKMNGSVVSPNALSGLADMGPSAAAMAALLMSLLRPSAATPKPQPLPAVVPEADPVPQPPAPEPLKAPQQVPEPLKVPQPEAIPEPDLKEPEPRPPSSRLPAAYSSVKRSREEIWPMVPVESKIECVSQPKRHRSSFGLGADFESYERPCASADEIAHAFAPKGQFYLEPNMKITPEECEDRIDELERRFKYPLSKQGIRKEREKRSVARAMIADYNTCLNNAEASEKLFVFVETLRKLASK